MLVLTGVSAEAAAADGGEHTEVAEPASSTPADEAARGKAFWEDDGPPPATEEEKASREAVASGKRVEVATLTTPNSQVFANSDGTFTVETATSPERVRQDGEWVAVDTTLVERQGGNLAPRAAGDIELSRGGADEPLARLSAEGKEYAISSPWELPEPVTQGSTAVYPSVLPDVDLAVQVHPDGFTYHLVLHSAEAASHPDLRAVEFPVETRGLSARPSDTGATTFVDTGGHAVVTSGSALMWDSAPSPGSAQSAAARLTGNDAEVSVHSLTAGPGARTAVMDTTVTDDALSIMPDQGFLADESTVFPVVLDPPAVKASLTGWTALWSDSPGTSFWKTKHALGVGYDVYVDNKKVRSLFQFDTRSVAGKKILGATFTAYEIWSANCTKKNVELWRTSTISSSTTWSKPPSWSSKVDTVSAAKGHSSSCPDGDVEFDATAAVAYTAKTKSTTTTLGLRADESDPIAWKQFMSPLDDRATSTRKPRLSITYVTPPNSKPSSVKMSDPNVSCSASSSPAVIRDATPRLTATPVSSDGSKAVLRPNFDLYKGSSTTPTRLYPSTWTASGTAGTAVTATLEQSTMYKFRARAQYKYTYGGSTGYLYGPWSSYCYFKVDTQGPPAPTVASEEYPECTGTTCEADPESGSVGMTGTFRITAGASDVRRYDWWLNGTKLGSKTFSTNTSAHSVAVTPDKRLTNTLRVQTFDAAGNAGTTKDYLFKVARAAGPVATWKFDEGSGLAAANAEDGGHDLALSASSWTEHARLGAGLKTGDGVYATTQGPVVDTTGSFAVSAWVRLTDRQQTVLMQQQGTNIGAFALYYSSSPDRWVFNRHATDEVSADTTVVRATSQRPPVLGAWTHLMGVYDRQAQKIRLYVNGQLDAETAFTTPWAAGGALEIGRWVGNPRLHADVDHVQVWNRVVFPDELWGVANMENPQTGSPEAALLAHWALDEDSGTVGADSSGRANSLNLQPGAVFTATDDPAHGNVMELDTTLLGRATSPVALDDSGSFTVAGWVNLAAQSKLENTAVAHSPSVFSHPGTQRNSFRLWYRQEAGVTVGDWNFGLFGTDVLGGPNYTAKSDEVNSPGGWMHVVGVYDSVNRSAKLYVTGQRQGDEEGAFVEETFQPTGPLVVGGARRHDTGEWGNPLPGQLDDLRVYAGVLSESEITRLATVDEPPVPIE
ncbi:Concanavalin A-like lectin/glucanases superfamily protein [Streptomyces radiopugnans]|uniref:Concanavalin A-like lectin/glucanases superfamily protein n=1 Tax=Streptomyces radiopugnans TaxID=403935 RepID=A0A1H9BAN0_9ACTN|nr:Concanavalin A-like lectin/glucanases superfamily protein [Streptomyces radiopugnans]